MFKAIVLTLSFLALVSSASAHDSTLKRPEIITQEWTLEMLSKTAHIDVEDASIDFVLKEYSRDISENTLVKLDYNNLALIDDISITYKNHKNSWLDFISYVSNEIGAEVEIVPGKVILRTPVEVGVREEKEIVKPRPEKPLPNALEKQKELAEKESASITKDPFWLWIIIAILLMVIAFLILRRKSK